MWFRQILDFRVKDLKFSIFVNFFIKIQPKNEIFVVKIQILWSRVNDLKFWFSLGLRISNFINLPNSKFFTKSSNFIKKILNYHKFFVGSRLLFEKHWYWRPQNLWEWIPPIHYHRKKTLKFSEDTWTDSISRTSLFTEESLNSRSF